MFVNPWITPGIIASVKTKCDLYEAWKNTISEENKEGDENLYTAYSNFRRKLKYTIKLAKKIYYGNKFIKHNGDIKKTWQLINELRGTVKLKNKPSVIIDGNLLT